FPPDDTGYGFDTIGDVLSISPMLLEKYMKVAEKVVAMAVPLSPKAIPERGLSWADFHRVDSQDKSSDKLDRLSYYKPLTISHESKVDIPGEYQVIVGLAQIGYPEFDPARCHVGFKIDDQQQVDAEYGWEMYKKNTHQLKQHWEAGDHRFTMELTPLVPE